MPNVNDFFTVRNTIKEVSADDQLQTSDYLEPVKAFAKISYESIYIIDYQQKGFEYVSENPLFLCGHTAEEVKELGYAFYFKNVLESDLDLLLKINNLGFEFYEGIPVEERKEYSISYDFHLKNSEGNVILINQKLTPIFLTEKGKIWKAMCIVSLSNSHETGNIKIYRKGSNLIYSYDLELNLWRKEQEVKLTSREKEILIYSIRGYKINEIADAIFVSSDTVKFHRRKLFDKLQVSNISEAIAYSTNNKLI